MLTVSKITKKTGKIATKKWAIFTKRPFITGDFSTLPYQGL